MKCQSVCPANREALDWREDGGEFSEEETALLLEGAPLAELPTSLVEKLRRWDLLQLQDVLPRNLGVRLCERVSGRDGP
jgi:epoxyqueuosine reductase